MIFLFYYRNWKVESYKVAKLQSARVRTSKVSWFLLDEHLSWTDHHRRTSWGGGSGATVFRQKIDAIGGKINHTNFIST